MCPSDDQKKHNDRPENTLDSLLTNEKVNLEYTKVLVKNNMIIKPVIKKRDEHDLTLEGHKDVENGKIKEAIDEGNPWNQESQSDTGIMVFEVSEEPKSAKFIQAPKGAQSEKESQLKMSQNQNFIPCKSDSKSSKIGQIRENEKASEDWEQGVEWRRLNVGGSSRKRKQTIGVRNANEETFASPDFEENRCLGQIRQNEETIDEVQESVTNEILGLDSDLQDDADSDSF